MKAVSWLCPCSSFGRLATALERDGRTLTTDGPFVDAEEVLGSYFMFEADNLDQTIELAARIPAARLGGAVEVRPLLER